MPDQIPAEILTRMDIAYEQTQLALLLLHPKQDEFPDTIKDLTELMKIWDRIRRHHMLG